MVSFYTTCMGRLYHLRQTLPQNMADNPDAQFVVLNYNSPDGLHDWIVENYSGEIAEGRLVYGRETKAKGFWMSHAKNMAARLATGDILVNIDADIFTGPLLDRKVEEFFKQGRCCLHGWTIGLRRDDFYHLGGYDEQFIGWGYEDVDMKKRASRRGIPSIWMPFGKRLDHTEEERERLSIRTLDESKTNNRALLLQNKRRKIIQVNPRGWGMGTVRMLRTS